MSRALKAAVIGLVVAGALVVAGPAGAAPSWAPAATATVHPGVQTYTEGGQCTANFVYYDATDIYIGQAAHCAGTGEATDTNGCDAGSLPLGTRVTFARGGSLVSEGTAVSSSNITRLTMAPVLALVRTMLRSTRPSL